MKRKLSLITIVCICCSFLAGGCGKKMKLEDAPVYAQAVLDAGTKPITMPTWNIMNVQKRQPCKSMNKV